MTEAQPDQNSKLKNVFLSGVMALGFVMAVTPPANADSAATGASATVQTCVDRTVSALDDADISDSEAASILEMVDVDRVAQFSLGNHWSDMNADQQARYVDAFRSYAHKQLKTHLSGFSKATVELGEVAERGDRDAIVQTIVANDDDRQTVSWRVMENGGWKVVDIEVQNVWFAIEQRAQFDAILDKNGGDIDALITEISA